MDSIQKASSKPSDLMEVFFSYAHEDEALRDELAKHLKLLERQGVIKAWSDRNITAGEEWKNVIDERLESANIILLLISADFLASDYCYDIELDRALERHKSKEARVIPIILRSSDWHSSSFGKLAALPTGGRAITSWPNEDEAFTDVVKGLRKAIEQIQGVSFPNTQGDITNNINPENKKNKVLMLTVGITAIGVAVGLIGLTPLLLRQSKEHSSTVKTETFVAASGNENDSTKPSSKKEPTKEPVPAKATSSPVSNNSPRATATLTPTVPPSDTPRVTAAPIPNNSPSSTPGNSPPVRYSPGLIITEPVIILKKFVPVIIEYDGSKINKDKVEKLKLALKNRKFESDIEDLSKRKDRDKFKIGENTEIRYYRDQDKKQAEEIKEFLKSQNIDAIIPNKSIGNEKQIEIWLSSNAL
jgi:hypothetical protein